MDVPPVLYNLVFGESVLNDATAIVLFRTLEEFYETPLSWGTVPLMFWRFFVIATGSIVIGELLRNRFGLLHHAHSCASSTLALPGLQYICRTNFCLPKLLCFDSTGH